MFKIVPFTWLTSWCGAGTQESQFAACRLLQGCAERAYRVIVPYYKNPWTHGNLRTLHVIIKNRITKTASSGAQCRQPFSLLNKTTERVTAGAIRDIRTLCNRSYSRWTRDEMPTRVHVLLIIATVEFYTTHKLRRCVIYIHIYT